ncbi:hypothetical protein PIB30_051332 [Stylosanthes scabra]|uniref:Uncharacterized protein n=1 Tax=Stylosanthes scabra TaxID=79078 RepID=A0ABU6VI11_9FABA|nr:hypothetical protein [Stylosanthes scabra]
MLDLRNELDRVGFDDFMWTPYMSPAWFHHVDRVKRQFGSEHPIPLDPVNLDRFLRASAKGEDKWWPTELDYWYGFWNNRRAREHQIQILHTHTPAGPPRNTLTGGWFPVDVGSCPRIVCFKILEASSCRMMCPRLRHRREIRSSCRAMHPLAEDGLRYSALISRGRVRMRLQVDGLSRAERMSTRRLSTVDRRIFPMG